MFRLIDDLARRRMIYPAPVAGMPNVVLIEVATRSRGAGLALGRYYPIIAETESELEEIDVFLKSPRERLAPPDLLDRRPTRIQSDRILLIRYDPPRPGWPWLSVCRWPGHLASTAGGALDMARGCYTIDAFEQGQALIDHQMQLLGSLATERSLAVTLLAADQMRSSGRA